MYRRQIIIVTAGPLRSQLHGVWWERQLLGTLITEITKQRKTLHLSGLEARKSHPHARNDESL
jgi:hypothetical protein